MATISFKEFSQGGGLKVVGNEAKELAKQEGVQGLGGFALGAGKGFLGGARSVAQLLQGTGQRVMAGIDPTRDLQDIREQTGLKSLDDSTEEGKIAREAFTPKGKAEKAGAVTETVAEFLLPVGVASKAKILSKADDAFTATKELLKRGSEPVKNTVETVKNIAGGLKDTASMAIDEASRLSSRIGTNVAEKQATREAIQNLPSKVAREAAQDGVDIGDIKGLYNIPSSQKAPLKKLVDIVQKFSKGETKTNPIEVVGKPITNRLKQLESARSVVGNKLGTVADKLGTFSTKEIFPTVFTALKKVPGLSGLKVSTKGILDFKNTVLSTSLTKADRAAIQKIFTEAVKNGSGKQKHLLRQELFEILGGKKRSLQQLTDTQEKAYNAIRQGISTALEGKNVAYKTLSNQYRKIVQPLAEMRKFMKNVAGADEDIMDMSAGLLARRLTSNSASNPQIRNILRMLDNATRVKGKTNLSIETLQDFYNILDRYYDIAGKTTFQGQVKAGVEKASGVKDFIFENIKGFAGETEAVRRQAIEKILQEILK